MGEFDNVRLLEIISQSCVDIHPDNSMDAMGFLIKSKTGRPIKVFLPSELAVKSTQKIHLAVAKNQCLLIYRHTGVMLLEFREFEKVLEFSIVATENGPQWDCEGYELQEEEK